MKNLRWLFTGFLAGLVVALAPSCGPSSKCDASTCPGCCTADGRCDPGTQANACGITGSLCAACGPMDQCQGGLCTPITGSHKDGGQQHSEDGGTDGGVDCKATECKASNGACIPLSQQTSLQCGNLGQACSPCTGTLVCDTTVGACRDTTCPGCVSNGSCAVGTSNTACGAGGLQCDLCGSGEMCQGGVCVPTGGDCSPSNCGGCCSSTGCELGTSTTACGVGGNACSVCSGSQTCSNGACGTATTVGVGSACLSDSDCTAALGATAVCKRYTSSYNGSYSGGYCTYPCTEPGACGSSAECFNLASFGEGDLQCYDLCSPADPCTRPGYSCLTTDDSGNGLCWIDPTPNPPVAPSGTFGKACSADSTCQASGSYPAGLCVPATENGSSTGWTGGYCIGDCTFAPGSCGTGGTCTAFNGTQGGYVGYCLQSCTGTGQSTCRAGYVCEQVPVYDGSGQVTTSGNACFPNCNNPGSGCPTGQSCLATGYCQ